MDRGAWWATIHGVAKNQMQLSMRAHTHICFFVFCFLFCSMKLLSAEKKGDIQYQKEFKET